jgi:hypothetical protein
VGSMLERNNNNENNTTRIQQWLKSNFREINHT